MTQSLICCGSRSSVVMQLVQVSQVSDCSYLQESEIVFAGTTKMGDVAMEGGTPVIVLADAAVAEQVVPPRNALSPRPFPSPLVLPDRYGSSNPHGHENVSMTRDIAVS